MEIAVIGANGNIGTRIVKLLLSNNHEVHALVHGTHSSLPTHANLTLFEGDIHDTDDVSKALKDCDAVISTLGSWGTKTKDILTAGMQTIVPIMKERDISRIISLTGSGVLLPTDQTKWYDHLNPLLLRIIQPKILEDGVNHIHILEESRLDWTVLRSPVMKDGEAKGYIATMTAPAIWKRITRDDVAQALVDQLDSPDHIRHAPFIA